MSNGVHLNRTGNFIQEFHLHQISIELPGASRDQISVKGRKQRIENSRYEFPSDNQMPLCIAKERPQFVKVRSVWQDHHRGRGVEHAVCRECLWCCYDVFHL